MYYELFYNIYLSFQNFFDQMDFSDHDIAEILTRPMHHHKTSKELTSIIQYIFENPKNLGSKFSNKSKNGSKSNNHLFDINAIIKFYENIDKLHLNDNVSAALKKSLSNLELVEKREDFMKNGENIRFLFLVLFWTQVFNPPHQENLFKFLSLLSVLGNFKGMFSKWCDDIPSEIIKKLVDRNREILEGEIAKLKNLPEHKAFQIQLNSTNILEFLQILYESNSRKPRIQSDHFVIKKLDELYKQVESFKKYLNKSKTLNFINYPFVLGLDYKYRLLQIQSIFQQKINMQKNMQSGIINFLSGHSQLDEHGNFSLESLMYLHFQINRNNILNDSMDKLCKIKHNLKNPLRIKFIGEQGTDQGGVQNQFFLLLTKQIFNPYLDMFLPKNNGRVYWFNGFSYQPPIRFEFVGMLLGLAIYNSVHLHVRFPKMLYKKLLSEGELQLDVNELLEQLNEIQPEYYRSMKQILDSQDDLEQLQLYFTIQIDSFGQKIVEELVEEGASIKLTQDNKSEYVYIFCQHLLNKHIQKQFRAFKKGFDRVVDTQLIKMFTPTELQTIICGNQVIDFHQLEANTHYQGYNKDSPVIKNLWKILHSLSHQDKKAFLMFCTGSDRVPLGGLKQLNFVIQKHANPTHLPTAHTCFNVLLFPEYESKEKIEKNIEFILKNNQGFGLI